MSAYEKIRAALDLAASIHDDRMPYAEEMRRDELVESALAALAELERAAREPRVWLAEPVAGDYASYIEMVARTPEKALANATGCYYAEFRAVPLYTAPPAPVVEIREAVITDEVARKVFNAWIDARWRLNEGQDAKYGHAMINVVRAELGPALGLVEIREPTPEECERICTEYERLLMREGTCGGRDAFDAVRAVMWPKSEGL